MRKSLGTQNISAFLSDRRGNPAMMFALLLVPLMIAGGMAVDLGRKGTTRSAVQEASDMAILRVARLKTLKWEMNDEELTAEARRIFDSATNGQLSMEIEDFRVRYDSRRETFTLEISADVPTAVLSVAGVKSLGIETVSSVKLGKPPYMEVALVMDNTGSMNEDGKLDAMKTAAADLTKSILSVPGSQTKVALVPFSQYVNVGSHGHGKFWMKDSGAAARGRGETTEADISAAVSPSGSGSSSLRSGSGPSWNGCVGSRAYPSNLEDGEFVVKPAPEVYDGTCPDEIQPLTVSKPTILTKIEDMKARGSTYIAGGLEWGWHVLTNQSPFREGVTLEKLHELGGIKAMVVLTDGDNTAAPTYPEHESSDRSLANSLTSRLCQQIKGDEIILYTISFGSVASSTRSLLSDCASSPSHYFAADNGAELSTAFATIASSLRMLSLSQ